MNICLNSIHLSSKLQQRLQNCQLIFIFDCSQIPIFLLSDSAKSLKFSKFLYISYLFDSYLNFASLRTVRLPDTIFLNSASSSIFCQHLHLYLFTPFSFTHLYIAPMQKNKNNKFPIYPLFHPLYNHINLSFHQDFLTSK